MDKSRIKVLDGFRAIAILGVLWAHIWMFFGNPDFTVFQVNIAQLISFFGTGVDSFSVISGFCMYLMFKTNTDQTINWGWNLRYLSKRWLRIAPAFYIAILVYGIISVNFNVLQFDLSYAFKNALFIRNFFPESSLYAPHFWSLSTEWQFYLILSFILWLIQRHSFKTCLTFLVLLCLMFRFFMALTNSKDEFNIINYSLPSRLIEFAMGIIMAELFLSQRLLHFQNIIALIFGVTLAFTGRVFLSAYFHFRADSMGVFARTFDLFLLSAGYAIVILNTLSLRSAFSRFLESGVMTSIGKYSYSMYLWHWLVAEKLSAIVKSVLNLNSFVAVNITFFLSLILLYPMSLISYKLFEAPYFRKRYSLSSMKK